MCGFLLLTLKTNDKSIFNQDFPEDHHSSPLICSLISMSSEFLKYRGKEQESYYHTRPHPDKFLFCYHSRLLTIGDSKDGHQPVISAEHISVFNGAVYNFAKIAHLSGSAPTSSDTDTICKPLALKEYWKSYKGPYAIAQYSIKQGTLDLARDPYGEKPLFYYTDNSLIIASSSALLITKLLVNFSRIERGLVRPELLKTSNKPSTDYKWFNNSIRLVKPGSKIQICEVGSISEEVLCETKSNSQINIMSSDHLSTMLIDALSSSLEQSTNTNGKIGLALSGGLDSSLLLAVARNIGLSDLQCFTTSYKTQHNSIDESLVASQYSSRLGYDHFSIEPDANFFLSNVDSMLRVLEAPPENSCMSAYSLYSLMKAHSIRISIEGQGADEMFAGYTSYIVNYLRGSNLFCAPLAAVNFTLNNHSSGKMLFIAWGLASLIANTIHSKKSSKIIAYLSSHNPSGKFKHYLARITQTKRLREQLDSDIEFNLQKLLMYGDKHSLLFNVEQRFPFLDKQVEAVSRLAPTNLLFCPYATKLIIRNACRSLNVPFNILCNKRKIGWEIPEFYWYTTNSNFRAWLASNSESSYATAILNKSLTAPQFRVVFKQALGRLWLQIQLLRLGLVHASA